MGGRAEVVGLPIVEHRDTVMIGTLTWYDEDGLPSAFRTALFGPSTSLDGERVSSAFVPASVEISMLVSLTIGELTFRASSDVARRWEVLRGPTKVGRLSSTALRSLRIHLKSLLTLKTPRRDDGEHFFMVDY